MLTVTEVVPLAEDVLLLLGLHHVLLLQTLQGEHAGGDRLAVAVLLRENILTSPIIDFEWTGLYRVIAGNMISDL